jgi:hypothetical protein
MIKQTVFEQVPLEVVKKVVEGQIKQQRITESGDAILKQEVRQLEQLLLPGSQTNGRGK